MLVKTVTACVEAMYADCKFKEIIPLHFEDSFAPTGWLGILCAGALYVEFCDPQKFDDNMHQLYKQLKDAVDRTKQGIVRFTMYEFLFSFSIRGDL